MQLLKVNFKIEFSEMICGIKNMKDDSLTHLLNNLKLFSQKPIKISNILILGI